jgi:surface protein
MTYLVGVCSSLEKLNLDNWSFYGNPTISNMFYDNSSLKILSAKNRIIPENFTQVLWCNRTQLCANDLVIDVSNWNLSKAKNLWWLFKSFYWKEVKWLYTWDTSGVTNMSQMFQNCSNLTWLDLSGFDTSSVTNMWQMFQWCSNLTWLDLSSFDTSNVNNVWGMFGWCSKLEEINLSGWDFRSYSNASLMMNMTAWWIPSLTKLNMTNTKYTWNATYAFGWLNKLEELNLNWADTSNVTSMNAMFNWDSNLKILHLSSFDTSNVKDMNKMFYNTPNLKTIYASENFVTTALSWDNSSKDMFSWTTSVVWWNWTKFDSNYIDE